jgi:hypothetical protein
MSQSPKSKSSSGLFLLALIPIIGASVFLWRLLGRDNVGEFDDASAFNLSVEPDNDGRSKRSEAYVSKFEKERLARKSGSSSGLGGYVAEKNKLYQPAAGEMSEREREKEFVRKYDHLVEAEQRRLTEISQRWYKKSAVVRKVDAEFAKMPRYMKLKAQYEKDRNMHNWARDVMKLPEVRRAILKHAKDPKVWQVAIGMSTEALKNPPPKKIQDEMMRFLTKDKGMTEWIGTFTKAVVPSLGKTITQAVPPGTDLKGLSKLGSAISGMNDPLNEKGNSPQRKRTSTQARPKR